jgi:LemA protein
LTATEDKIEFSRRYYNTSARDFNTSLQTLPTSLIGGMLGFKAFSYFEADAADREVPQVSFGTAGAQPPAGPAAGTQQPATPPPSSGAQPTSQPPPTSGS